MRKVKQMQIVVTMTDGEKIEGDTATHDEMMADFQKRYPNHRASELEEALDETLATTIDTLSQINRLSKFVVTVNGNERAINPSLVKYVDFKVEWQG